MDVFIKKKTYYSIQQISENKNKMFDVPHCTDEEINFEKFTVFIIIVSLKPDY